MKIINKLFEICSTLKLIFIFIAICYKYLDILENKIINNIIVNVSYNTISPTI
jgi:hypothetical protein